MCVSRVKMSPLLQLVATRLLSSRYQDVFALLVPSCCDKSGTSCYHLLTRLMMVTDSLQVVPTRLIQAVRNKLLRACCHQLVNNLLRADDIRLAADWANLYSLSIYLSVIHIHTMILQQSQ